MNIKPFIKLKNETTIKIKFLVNVNKNKNIKQSPLKNII
jgi:hypothetical protein